MNEEAATRIDSTAREAAAEGHGGPVRRRRCVTVTNPLGLHMRAASKFVHLASGFRATIGVTLGDRLANGKSILDLATLAADCGSHLEIEASGSDAEAALAALTALVEAGFQEEDD